VSAVADRKLRTLQRTHDAEAALAGLSLRANGGVRIGRGPAGDPGPVVPAAVGDGPAVPPGAVRAVDSPTA
jgi:hypothetical protein